MPLVEFRDTHLIAVVTKRINGARIIVARDCADIR